MGKQSACYEVCRTGLKRRADAEQQQLGFTLIEVLVAIAIIGILMALLLPAVQAARESGRRVECQHHLRQLALANQTYHDAQKCFPPGVNQSLFVTPPVYRGFTWFVALLPYMEDLPRALTWERGDPLKNANGGSGTRTATILPMLLCPSDVIPANPIQTSQGWYYALTSYGGNGGTRSYFPTYATTDGIFFTGGPASDPQPNQRPVRIVDIRDGASNTILLGERNHYDPNFESFATAGWCASLAAWGYWGDSAGKEAIGHVTLSAFAPLNYQLPFGFQQRDSANPPASDPNLLQYYFDRRMSSFGSNHPGGANFALADGSTRFLSDALAAAAFQALCTRSGQEAVEPQ